MNHFKAYWNLMFKARQRRLADCYVERHHAVPRSEGGGDEPDNLVNLTAREHYVAHLLLAKIYDDRKMHSAVTVMHAGRAAFRFSSRLYEHLRRRFSELHSQKMRGENNPWFGRHSPMYGRRHSEETKKRISLANAGKNLGRRGQVAWNKGKKLPEETKRKISKALRGRLAHRQTEESRRKNSEAHKGLAVGKRWWNDGRRCVMARECPPGFVKGRLSRK